MTGKQRTPGQVYTDIQDTEGDIMLAGFHGYDASVAVNRLNDLRLELAASKVAYGVTKQ